MAELESWQRKGFGRFALAMLLAFGASAASLAALVRVVRLM